MPGDPDAGDDLRGTYTYLMSVAKPVIAAINGPVAGMGVPVALACDLRWMSTSAVVTTSFAQRGLIAEWGIAWQLSRLVGPAHALDLLFSARKVGAEEAERIGLVNRAVAPDELLPAGTRLRRRPGRALLAGVDRRDEATGVPRPPPRPRRRRAATPNG